MDLRLESLSVLASPVQLRQVLRNLLTNAMNYSPPSTTLGLATMLAEPQPIPAIQEGANMLRVRIAIKDQGIGITPEEQGQLFQPFVRLERGKEMEPRGSGLGLFLCKQIIEAMHGQIWIESEGIPGQGSTVWLSLLKA